MGKKNRVGVLSTPTLAGLFLPVVPVAHTGESVDLGIAGGYVFPVVPDSDVTLVSGHLVSVVVYGDDNDCYIVTVCRLEEPALHTLGKTTGSLWSLWGSCHSVSPVVRFGSLTVLLVWGLLEVLSTLEPKVQA